MQHDELPRLYRVADQCSNETQKLLAGLTISQAILLLAGAAVSTIGASTHLLALTGGVLFIASLVISVYLAYANLEKVWYQARAVAESVKTTAWRYAMRAEPFTNVPNVELAKSEYFKRIKKIHTEHRGLSEHFVVDENHGQQLTNRMQQIRQSSVSERLSAYRTERIKNQREWYTRKARFNKLKARFWILVLICTHAAAILCVMLRVAYPIYQSYYPVDVFATAASLVIAWTSFRRYRELASAYFLAAEEIGLIDEESNRIDGEESLSEFVQDAENAFSREHTQWIARKDQPYQ